MFASNLQLVHSEPEKSVTNATKETEKDSEQDHIDEYGDNNADRDDLPP